MKVCNFKKKSKIKTLQKRMKTIMKVKEIILGKKQIMILFLDLMKFLYNKRAIIRS